MLIIALCGCAIIPGTQTDTAEDTGTGTGPADGTEAVSRLPSSPDEVKTGDILLFGRYYRDNDWSEERDPIEWEVLAKDGGRVLLITKYGIDYQVYDSDGSGSSWEASSLCGWLNGIFCAGAFSGEELARIGVNSQTGGRLFLLSTEEAADYFASDSLRMCAATDYAAAWGASGDGTHQTGGKPSVSWWLRPSGAGSDNAPFVKTDGTVDETGTSAKDSKCCVRPALWITLG